MAVDSSSIFIDDSLPTTLEYDGATTVSFTNGTVASGLAWNVGTDVRWTKSAATPAAFTNCVERLLPDMMRPSGICACAPRARWQAQLARASSSFTVSFLARVK